MQTKLHRWATEDGERRFDDLFNLVAGVRTGGPSGRPAPSVRDQVVQAALEFVLEPNFEADLEACFDDIDHTALLDRMR